MQANPIEQLENVLDDFGRRLERQIKKDLIKGYSIPETKKLKRSDSPKK